MSRTAKRTILLFTRAPEAEARAKGLPVEPGSRLFEAFLSGWRDRAEEAGAELLVAAPTHSLKALRRLFPDECVTAQRGSTFAARMEAAFALAFERGAGSVLMAGGDSPALDGEDIQEAFAHLESHGRAIALAPATDGGVNVIGLNAGVERRLEDIAWFGADVERQLLETACEQDLSVWIAASAPDLDRRGDVAELYRLSRVQLRWRTFGRLLAQLLVTGRRFVRLPDASPRRVSLDGPVTRGPPAGLAPPASA